MTLTTDQASTIRDQLRAAFIAQMEKKAVQPPGAVLCDAKESKMGPSFEIVIPEWSEHIWIFVHETLNEIVVLGMCDDATQSILDVPGGFTPTLDYIHDKSDAEGFGVFQGPTGRPELALAYVFDWIYDNPA